MQTSTTIGEIATALVAAESEIHDPKRDGKNPHFKSTYITLDSVIEATRGPLAKQGIRVIQSPGTGEGGVPVTTRLLHAKSGEWIEDTMTMPLPPNATPQAVGSAITYARRYALLGMLNLGGEDDDGNAAEDAHKAREKVPSAFPGTVQDLILKVDKVERKNKAGKPFNLYTIHTAKHGELNTFEDKMGEFAYDASEAKAVVSITGEPNGNYAPKCTAIGPAKDPADDLPF